MSPEEIQALQTRLHEVVESVSNLADRVGLLAERMAATVAICEICRPVAMSMNDRVTKIETTLKLGYEGAKVVGKVGWAIAAGVGGVVATIMTEVFKAVFGG